MKKFFKINNKSDMDLSESEALFHDFGQYAQKEMGFKKPPILNFVSDKANSMKPLGKTAFYNPDDMSVTIFTDKRHVKDIIRSLAHELVHHLQNEEGRLDVGGYHGEGYAQKNLKLRALEEEAMKLGNLCMRDWEDKLKQQKPTIYNERRIYSMSTKEWKNKELSKLMTERFGFKMDLNKLNEEKQENLEENEDQLEEEAKPDFLDLDKDGDKEESMKKAAEDAKEKKEMDK